MCMAMVPDAAETALPAVAAAALSSRLSEQHKPPEGDGVLVRAYRTLCTRQGVARANSYVLHELRVCDDATRLAVLPTQSFTSCPISLPALTKLDLSSVYLGPRQVRALADLLRVDRRHFHGTPSREFWGALDGGGVQHMANSFSAASISYTASTTTTTPGGGKSSSGATMTTGATVTWFAGCTLLPHLATLVLRDARLSFGAALTSRAAADDEAVVGAEQDGNAVLLYLLRAVQGHPSLCVLDLCENAIGAYLLPAFSALLRTTPSLRTIRLDGTLLLPREKQLIAAQCTLNELRDNALSSEARQSARTEWLRYQEMWLGAYIRRLMKDDAKGTQ